MKLAYNKNKIKLYATIVGAFALTQFGYMNVNAETKDLKPLTTQDAIEIHNGILTMENGFSDSLLLNHRVLDPNADDDGDGLKNNQELFTYMNNGKKYLYYKSHPLLKDTDGDGIEDSKDSDPLSWNVSDRDAVIFQELIYRNDDYIREVLNPYIPLTLYKDRVMYKLMRNEMGPYWKLEKTWHYDTGFDAGLFTFTNKTFPFLKNESVHILAIRGTSDSKDVANDSKIAFGNWPSQANNAVAVADEINRDGYRNVYVTGHSLGGYLSHIFFVRSIGADYEISKRPKDPNKHRNPNIKGIYTFNAPRITSDALGWFNPWTYEYSKVNKKIYDTNYSNESNMKYVIKDYVTGNDPITKLTGAYDNRIKLEYSKAGHSSTSFFEHQFTPFFASGDKKEMDGGGYTEIEPSKIDYSKPTTIEFTDIDGNKVGKKVYSLNENILSSYDFSKDLPEGYYIVDSGERKYGEVNKVTVDKKPIKLTYKFMFNGNVVKEIVVNTKYKTDYNQPKLPELNDPNYEYTLENPIIKIPLDTIIQDRTIEVDLAKTERIVKTEIQFKNGEENVGDLNTIERKITDKSDIEYKSMIPEGYELVNPNTKVISGILNNIEIKKKTFDVTFNFKNDGKSIDGIEPVVSKVKYGESAVLPNIPNGYRLLGDVSLPSNIKENKSVDIDLDKIVYNVTYNFVLDSDTNVSVGKIINVVKFGENPPEPIVPNGYTLKEGFVVPSDVNENKTVNIPVEKKLYDVNIRFNENGVNIGDVITQHIKFGEDVTMPKIPEGYVVKNDFKLPVDIESSQDINIPILKKTFEVTFRFLEDNTPIEGIENKVVTLKYGDKLKMVDIPKGYILDKEITLPEKVISNMDINIEISKEKEPEKVNEKEPEKGNEKEPEKGNEKEPEKGNEKEPEKGNEKEPEKVNEKEPEKGNEKEPEKGNEKEPEKEIEKSKFKVELHYFNKEEEVKIETLEINKGEIPQIPSEIVVANKKYIVLNKETYNKNIFGDVVYKIQVEEEQQKPSEETTSNTIDNGEVKKEDKFFKVNIKYIYDNNIVKEEIVNVANGEKPTISKSVEDSDGNTYSIEDGQEFANVRDDSIINVKVIRDKYNVTIKYYDGIKYIKSETLKIDRTNKVKIPSEIKVNDKTYTVVNPRRYDGIVFGDVDYKVVVKELNVVPKPSVSDETTTPSSKVNITYNFKLGDATIKQIVKVLDEGKTCKVDIPQDIMDKYNIKNENVLTQIGDRDKSVDVILELKKNEPDKKDFDVTIKYIYDLDNVLKVDTQKVVEGQKPIIDSKLKDLLGNEYYLRPNQDIEPVKENKTIELKLDRFKYKVHIMYALGKDIIKDETIDFNKNETLQVPTEIVVDGKTYVMKDTKEGDSKYRLINVYGDVDVRYSVEEKNKNIDVDYIADGKILKKVNINQNVGDKLYIDYNLIQNMSEEIGDKEHNYSLNDDYTIPRVENNIDSYKVYLTKNLNHYNVEAEIYLDNKKENTMNIVLESGEKFPVGLLLESERLKGYKLDPSVVLEPINNENKGKTIILKFVKTQETIETEPSDTDNKIQDTINKSDDKEADNNEIDNRETDNKEVDNKQISSNNRTKRNSRRYKRDYANKVESMVVKEKIVAKNPVEGAIMVSKKMFKNGTNNVVLVNSEKTPDIISSLPLANYLKASLLFTNRKLAPKMTIEEISRLKAKTVYIIGGKNSISKNQVKEFNKKGIKVIVIDGKDRQDTSLKISKIIINEKKKELKSNKKDSERFRELEDNIHDIVYVKSSSLEETLSIAPIAMNHELPIVLGFGKNNNENVVQKKIGKEINIFINKNIVNDNKLTDKNIVYSKELVLNKKGINNKKDKIKNLKDVKEKYEVKSDNSVVNKILSVYINNSISK